MPWRDDQDRPNPLGRHVYRRNHHVTRSTSRKSIAQSFDGLALLSQLGSNAPVPTNSTPTRQTPGHQRTGFRSQVWLPTKAMLGTLLSLSPRGTGNASVPGKAYPLAHRRIPSNGPFRAARCSAFAASCWSDCVRHAKADRFRSVGWHHDATMSGSNLGDRNAPINPTL